MKKIKLNFLAGVEYQGKVYASSREINGLFQLDIITHDLVYLKRFSKEKAGFGLHRKAYLYKNEAWFIPGMSQYITVVNLDTLEMDSFKIPSNGKERKAISKIKVVYYSGGIIEDRYLYLVPTNIDALLLIDLKTKKFYPYYDVAKPDECLTYGTYVDGNIYLFPYVGNDVIKINLKTKATQRYSCKWPNGIYANFVYVSNKFWIIPRCAGYILKTDLDFQHIERYFVKDCFDEGYMYQEIFVENGMLFVLPFSSNRILKFNINNGQLSQIYLKEEWLNNGKTGMLRLFSEDKTILISNRKNLLFLYDYDRDFLQEIELNIEREVLLEEFCKKDGTLNLEEFCYDGCYNENYLGLVRFVGITSDQSEQRKNKCRDIGKTTWNALKTGDMVGIGENKN